MNYEVAFYQNERGDYPVKNFIEEQELPIRTKIAHSIKLLMDYGPYIRFPYSKKIQSNLFELRISGKIAIRIFYIRLNNKYYLLHIFKKKSKKTPPKEIETAVDRTNKII